MGHRSTISLVEDVESMHIGVDGNGWKPLINCVFFSAKLLAKLFAKLGV
jgi:hypothetical protein